MRILICGCGYVGRELARAATAAGHEVWALTRNGETLQRLEIPVQRCIQADLHTNAWHLQARGDWDAVINLVSSAGGGLTGYRTSYIEGNQSIILWASARRVNRFIYTSATSVYPQVDGEWVGEDDVPPRDFLSPSGQLLRDAEESVLAATVFGSAPIILRLAGIYGPGRHLYLDWIRSGATSIPGDGNAYLNLVYRDDIVAVILHCLAMEPPGTPLCCNICDDSPAQKQEIVDWLTQQLKLPSLRFDSSASLARAPRRRDASGRLPNRRVSNARARSILGWQPAYSDFRAGYRALMEELASD